MGSPYRQNIDACLTDDGQPGLLPRALFETRLAATEAALDRLRASHADGSLPLLHLPDARDDLGRIAPFAGRYRNNFDEVVVLGTGGSSLGGKSLNALCDQGFGPTLGSPRLHFIDNIDPETFRALLESINPLRTGFVAISKSGATAETLTQLLIALECVRAARGEEALRTQFLFITEQKDSVLTRLAQRFSIDCLPHDPNIGGRFSVLSLVGLLPAMIAGVDTELVRVGAADVLQPVLDKAAPADVAPAAGAALSVGLAEEAGITQTVLMPYADRLADFALWYRQLWAESIGKQGYGTTPVRAMGTVDQHSQLQLYLDGPADKMYSLVQLATKGAGARLADDLTADESLSYLTGRTIGDLMDAEQRATAETLIAKGRPVRIFTLETLDERATGALMMHFMLETIIAADLIGIDPFDQPAVEQGKVLARSYMDAFSDAGTS